MFTFRPRRIGEKANLAHISLIFFFGAYKSVFLLIDYPSNLNLLSMAKVAFACAANLLDATI